MKQTVFTVVVVLVIIGMLTAVVLGSRGRKAETPVVTSLSKGSSTLTPAFSTQVPIFFYGNTCPHCKDVEGWMEENKIEEKVELVKKEVYDNRANSLELSQAAQSCGLSTSSIGVPFVFTPEGECLIGTPDIVNYFSGKAGLSSSNNATESGKENEL